MKDWSKRLFSTVLAVTLLVSNIQPAFAFAAEGEDTGLCEHHRAHENCNYVAAVAGADCTHEHGEGCFAVKCTHVHGECGYVAATEDKDEIPCGHDCAVDENCREQVLSCTHSHDESCGYVEAVEGKACEFVCEACAAEEASAAAVAEVKALIDVLPSVDAVQAMPMEEQKTAYEQTQAAYEAYGKLTEEQQKELTDPEEVFKSLFEYFNTLISADGEIGSGTPDGTAPVLNGLTISATSVTIPGEVEVIVDASDNVSGIDSGEIILYCKETKKRLHFNVWSDYFDLSLGERVKYSDGKLHGTLEIDQYVETGTFIIHHLYLSDKAGNTVSYYNDEVWSEGDNRIPDAMKQIQLLVTESDTPDGAPPTLHGMTISATEVTAPGEVEVIVDASDNVSGIDGGEIILYCKETKKRLHFNVWSDYYDLSIGERVKYADGKLHGMLEIDQYVETGTFIIHHLYISDKAGNTASYYNDEVWSEGDNGIPDAMKQIQLLVRESDTPDGTPPTLNGMTLSATEITAPGEVGVIVDASDNVSGIDSGEIILYCKETKKRLHFNVWSDYFDLSLGERVKYSDGKLHGTLEIDQYVETGTFIIHHLYLSDKAGNTVSYYNDEVWSEGDNGIPDAMKQIQLVVSNVGADITTSTSQSTFVQEVTNAANDAYIVADFSSNSKLPQGAFDGIKESNKTLELTSEGVTWQFKGTDITEDTKDIDLSVQISKADNNQDIQDSLNGNPGYIMKFAENGTLPGKATIQIKVDYAMRQHLGSSTGLNVYYYNNQTGELELVAQNLTVINDTYVEFSITHCSYYVLTATDVSSSVQATGKCGENLTWALDGSGTLTISGTGEMWNMEVGKTPWDAYLDQIVHIIVEEGVLSIGHEAFWGCDALTNVTLSEGLLSLGDSSFLGCRSLKQIDLPDTLEVLGEQAFFQCFELESIYIPASVQEIGDIPFGICESLSAITVDPANQHYCNDENGFLFSKDKTVLHQVLHNISGSYTVPEGVKEINRLAFDNCSSLTEIIIPDSVTIIGQAAFGDCRSLKTIRLPSKLTRIEWRLFMRCLALESITIPASVKSFDNQVFADIGEFNGALSEIIFEGPAPQISELTFEKVTAKAYYPANDPTWTPDILQNYGGNITWVSYESGLNGQCGDNSWWRFDPTSGTLTISGTGYFSGFEGTASGRKYYWEEHLNDIKRIVVEDGITTVGSHAFDGCINAVEVTLPESVNELVYGTFNDCSSLKSIVIPKNVTELYWTFRNCTSLNDVTLPVAITEIGEGAFFGCSSLKQIAIPASVTSIGNGAFSGCVGFTDFVVPDQITSIGAIAFNNCTNLKKITFEGDAPRIWEAIDDHPDGQGAFAGCILTAYYPNGNATWTEAVMKQYGGNITWKPYCLDKHSEVIDKAVEATCTATGLTEGKHCSVCGIVLTAQTTVAAKGHNYVNGYCSRCGTAAPSSGGSTGNGGSTNTGTGNAGTTTRPTTKPNQNGVELSAKELEASADRNVSTTMVVDSVRITFDAKSQKAIAEQAAKDTIKLHYEEIKEAKLSNTQKKAIKNHLSDHKGQKHVLTFTISLISGGKEIHDFKGGIATLKIPFTPNPGTKGNEYKVFFVDNNGDIIPMETTYENGCLVVKLTHFSTYVVFHVPEEVDEEATEATEATTTIELAVGAEEPVADEVQSVHPVKAPKTDAVGMILRIVIALCTVGILVIGVILLSMRKNKK